MSAPENKSDDKKDIEMEEREKIKNAENIAQDKIEDVDPKDGKVNITEKEGREVKPKKIPIGGIQMPGFFTRSRSKEKCKDSESEQGGNDAEGAELLESAKEQTNLEEKPQRIKLPNPFGKKVKSADSGDGESILLILNNSFYYYEFQFFLFVLFNIHSLFSLSRHR